jgi:hypothetical protein
MIESFSSSSLRMITIFFLSAYGWWLPLFPHLPMDWSPIFITSFNGRWTLWFFQKITKKKLN